MATAQVWNDSEKEYSEKFREEWIRIPGKAHIVMDLSDAALFMGQAIPIKKNDMGEFLNEKRLRMVRMGDSTADPRHRCQMCGDEFQTEKGLLDHSLVHKDRVVKDRK